MKLFEKEILIIVKLEKFSLLQDKKSLMQMEQRKNIV